jgi:hypothetical protein
MLRFLCALSVLLMGCRSGSSASPAEAGSDAADIDAESTPDAPGGAEASAEAALDVDAASEAEPPVREDGGIHGCPPEDEEVAQVCCAVAAPADPSCTTIDGGCYDLSPCDPCPSEGGTAPACGALGQSCADPSGSGVVMACGFRCVGPGGPCP